MRNSSTLEILADFVALFYPQYCRACDNALVKGENIICTSCLLELPRSNYHRERDNPFFNKFKGRIPVEFVMTLFKFVKNSRVQHLLHALKYKDAPEIGVALGRLYGNDLLETHSMAFDLIVPIPLHPSKKRKRGYNQSAEFGKGLGIELNIPCSDEIVGRRIATETQTRKSKLNRWENVEDVFEVVKVDSIIGKRILLVDDVVTTGATLEACGERLLQAGCRNLSIACIAAAQ